MTTRITYKTALRARGVKPLPANWSRPTPKPGDYVLGRLDRPIVIVPERP